MANGRIVFFGTPDICLPFLEALKKNYDIKLVITQPDAHGGRRKKIITPAVKDFAIRNQIDYQQPEKLKNPILIEKIKRINPLIGIVISYGKFIPEIIYKIPLHNTINVHFSLLPRYRGAEYEIY